MEPMFDPGYVGYIAPTTPEIHGSATTLLWRRIEEQINQARGLSQLPDVGDDRMGRQVEASLSTMCAALRVVIGNAGIVRGEFDYCDDDVPASTIEYYEGSFLGTPIQIGLRFSYEGNVSDESTRWHSSNLHLGVKAATEADIAAFAAKVQAEHQRLRV